jgi:hypothetical protein
MRTRSRMWSKGIAVGIFLRGRRFRFFGEQDESGSRGWDGWVSIVFFRGGASASGQRRRHDLQELLVIALCAVLCGGESCVDMADFAEEKEVLLRKFLSLQKGSPSHDMFSRVLCALELEQFRRCFQDFMGRFSETCQGVIAIAGKVLRRSLDTASVKSSLHMVSASGCEQRLVLSQIATDAKRKKKYPPARSPRREGKYPIRRNGD